jgi:hypothetical protein
VFGASRPYVVVCVLASLWVIGPVGADPISMLGMVTGAGVDRALQGIDAASAEARAWFPGAPRPKRDIAEFAQGGFHWRGDQIYPTGGPHGADAGGYRIQNVLWDYRCDAGKVPPLYTPEFDTTSFNINDVTKVSLLMSPLEPKELASHAALMFEFKGTAPLKRESGKPAYAYLIISAEARVEVGETLTLSKAFSGQLPLIHVLEGTDAFRQSVTYWGSGQVSRYRLKMDEQEAQAALKTALAMALADHSKQRYHLLNNSCVTNAAKVINGGLRLERRFHYTVIAGTIPRPQISVASWFPDFLRANGYLNEAK